MIELSFYKTLRSSSGKMLLDIQLKIEEGSFVALYGKSGAGKTSTLRILAGLLSADEGRIVVHDKIWLDTMKGINLKPRKRNVGFLFQDYALFPNMTVKENLLFALEKGQDKKIVPELMEVIELGALQNQKPEKLSGGQQQRVALARALVQKPEVLLLDEPLSALDNEIRAKLQEHLLRVHREFGLTTILVSHNMEEVLKLSDKVVVLEEGKITRKGNPEIIFEQKISGNHLRFSGEIIALKQRESIYIITIKIGTDEVIIEVDKNEGKGLKIGERISVAIKALSTMISKS